MEVGKKYFWRVRAKNIGGSGDWSDIFEFSTTPEPPRLYILSDSWNLISLSMTVPDLDKTIIFPSANSDAFTYSASGTYTPQDTLKYGVGYWLKFPSAESLAIYGARRLSDTLNVMPGWNLIGSIDKPVSIQSIIKIPSDIITSNYYGYRNQYYTSDFIEPGKGYWVKVNCAGKLILQ